MSKPVTVLVVDDEPAIRRLLHAGIARGVLAVERGTISAANCSDGGARFTMVVPAEVK